MSNFGFRALVQAHSLPERSGSLVKTDHIRESLSEVRADRPHDKFIQVHFRMRSRLWRSPVQPFREKRIGIPDRDGDNGNRMQIAPEITFEGTEPSPAAREAILKEIERLETHNQRITGCRVSVIAPSHKHRHGTGFEVHIWLTIPPHENIVVNHSHVDDVRHEHVEVAIRDAFANARRQVDALAI
jgi:ribosome-associated translation inhibitor RaiA